MNYGIYPLMTRSEAFTSKGKGYMDELLEGALHYLSITDPLKTFYLLQSFIKTALIITWISPLFLNSYPDRFASTWMVTEELIINILHSGVSSSPKNSRHECMPYNNPDRQSSSSIPILQMGKNEEKGGLTGKWETNGYLKLQSCLSSWRIVIYLM